AASDIDRFGLSDKNVVPRTNHWIRFRLTCAQFRDFHNLQRYFRPVNCCCLEFFPWLRAHDRFSMKNLNRSCCALSETAGGGHQLIEAYLALHLNSRRLTNRAKHCCGWAALPLCNTHTHLR